MNKLDYAIQILYREYDEHNKQNNFNTKLTDEVSSLGMAISILQNTCPICSGTGIKKFRDAAGSPDTKKCEKCNGTGKG